MSHKILRPLIVKVSVLGYFPLYIYTYADAAFTVSDSKYCNNRLNDVLNDVRITKKYNIKWNNKYLKNIIN